MGEDTMKRIRSKGLWALRRGVVVLLTLGFTAPVFAGEETTVKAIGQAAIYGEDVVNARDKAIDDALRKAVEQAVGTLVSSETVTENFQLISDKIISAAKGYIRNYKVTAEGKEAGVYSVTVEASVAKGNLSEDLNGILQVLKSRNMPRVLVMISEQNIGGESTSWWGKPGATIDLGVVENVFIDQWNPRGIRFVDRQAIAGELKTAGPLTGGEISNGQAKAFGTSGGAEVVVIGKAVATDSGTILDTAMHSLQATISVRALAVDTGEIIATATLSKTTGHINAVTGGSIVLKQVTLAAADSLLKKILVKWEGEVGGPSTVQLTLTNVRKSKFLRQVATTLRNEVRGVVDVRQRSFRKGKAQLEVELKGSAQTLAEELEDKSFSLFEVEITEITANTVTAKLLIKK